MSSLYLTVKRPKDPQEASVKYSMNWSGDLETDETILTSAWSVASGLTVNNDTISSDGKSTNLYLSGGVADMDYPCENTVTTSEGQTLQRTGMLPVREL